MQPLWAPWRMDYVTGEKPEGCVFCALPAAQADRENLVLGRSALSFAVLNRFPYNNGHLMVIPRRHCGDLVTLSEEEYADLHWLLRTSLEVLRAAIPSEGLNVGMNLGKAAGAGIEAHLHYHLVPRWVGDTNFMPVLSETRVIVEHLDATWAKLRPGFDAALGVRADG